MNQQALKFLCLILLPLLVVECEMASVQTDEPGPIVVEYETTASPTDDQNIQSMPEHTPITNMPITLVTMKDLDLQTPSMDIPHYKMDIDLDYTAHIAEITQEINIRNNSLDEWNQLVFHVAASRLPGTFVLRKIYWADNPAKSPEHSFDPVTLTLAVNFETPLLPGEQTALNMEYSLDVPPTSYDQWPPQGIIGYNANIMQFGNWYPAIVPYENTKGWKTWPFTEVGDPFVMEIAEYDLEVIADNEFVVVSGGIKNHSSGLWRFHYDKARAISFSVSPRYQFRCDQMGRIEICSYYLPEHEIGGLAVLETAKEAIVIFESYYGPYPYSSITFAENAFFGSMEYSTFVLHSGAAYAQYDGNPNTMLIRMTAHEIAHQWWYSLVGTDQVYEPWLDEGLAMFSELLFYRNRYPELENWFWESLVNIYQPSGNLERNIYDFSDNQTYYHQLYRRGMLFLDELERKIGTDQFKIFLQDVRKRYENQMLSTDGFIELLSVSIEDIGPLIAKYFPSRSISEPLNNP